MFMCPSCESKLSLLPALSGLDVVIIHRIDNVLPTKVNVSSACWHIQLLLGFIGDLVHARYDALFLEQCLQRDYIAGYHIAG